MVKRIFYGDVPKKNLKASRNDSNLMMIISSSEVLETV